MRPDSNRTVRGYAAAPETNQRGRLHRADYSLLVLIALLLGVGLVVLYAVSPALQAPKGASAVSYYVGRQSIAIVLGLIAFTAMATIPLAWWRRYTRQLTILGLVVCLLAIAIGGMANRWIQIGGLSFQPAELVKIVVAIGLAHFLVQQRQAGQLRDHSKTLIPILKVIGAYAFVIVVLQRDLGSMLVLVGMAMTMMVVGRVPVLKLLQVGLIGVALIGIAIAATPYRRDRMLTFLQPERDCLNEGYHACQALIAVGTGGITGLGLGRSIQATGYLPEAANDSIFAIYAEMFGFFGSIVLLVLYGLLLNRILHIIEHSADAFSRLMLVGIFCWMAAQIIMNVGAMLGIMPLKGITLPFISYGGSSVIMVMAAMGLVFQVSRYTTVRKVIADNNEEVQSNANRASWRGVGRPYYTGTRRRS